MNRYIEEVALSGVPGHTLELTPAKALKIAKAYLLLLTEKCGKVPSEITIAIGQDPRLSGKLLKVACFDALVPYGVHCFDCNISATPAMQALAAGGLKSDAHNISCDGAIMITSSRGEPHINGFKIFDAEGLLKEEDYSKILQYVSSENDFAALGEKPGIENFKMTYGKKVYNTTDLDLNAIYSSYLCHELKSTINSAANFELPLLGMKIAVDASNGTGGFIARNVFAKLGADISASQYLDPDGNFFNHAPNPDDTAAKHSISMKTLANGCDLGFLFDSDLSTFVVFDKLGFEIESPNTEIDISRWLLENLKSFTK